VRDLLDCRFKRRNVVLQAYDLSCRSVAGTSMSVSLPASRRMRSACEDRVVGNSPRCEIQRQQRNEYDAVEGAIPDLIRLERYERRAWSRQKRAIQQFVLIKFNCAMAAARQMPTT
jgi:hypothetical protein